MAFPFSKLPGGALGEFTPTDRAFYPAYFSGEGLASGNIMPVLGSARVLCAIRDAI